MPRGIFIKLFAIFNETGENHLDTYTQITHLMWDMGDNGAIGWVYDFEKIREYEEHLSIARRHRIFDADTLSDCRNFIKSKYKEHQEYIERIANEPRKQANRYIAKTSTRNEVFKLHGKACLCCSTDKNITIDHVIPVFLGGADSIENLQPLCKSCNSKKKTTIKDYRNG